VASIVPFGSISCLGSGVVADTSGEGAQIFHGVGFGLSPYHEPQIQL
jgi:hypothetical protein